MTTRKVTVAAAVKKDRLTALRALRDVVAAEIDAAQQGRSMTQTAPLAKQLRETLAEIAALEKLQPRKSVVDELSRKRDRRIRPAKDRAQAGGDSQTRTS